MTTKVLAFTIPISALFYCLIPLMYLFPHISEKKVVGTVMLLVAFFVVAPTAVTLIFRLYSSGLRKGGLDRASGSQV
jgi:Na+-driven multidrug efflux pump